MLMQSRHVAKNDITITYSVTVIFYSDFSFKDETDELKVFPHRKKKLLPTLNYEFKNTKLLLTDILRQYSKFSLDTKRKFNIP